jgi:hypothetical protein
MNLIRFRETLSMAFPEDHGMDITAPLLDGFQASFRTTPLGQFHFILSDTATMLRWMT